MKPEESSRPLNPNDLKPGLFQPCRKGIRTDGDKGVAKVNEPHERARETVAARQFASRTQDSSHLAKRRILQLRGMHMVQHGECCASGKRRIMKRHGSRIACYDLDVGAAHPHTQRFCQAWIGFDGRKTLRAKAKNIGSKAGARTNLQN